MKLKALAVLLILLVSMFPAYLLYKYAQKKIRPKESFGRLMAYFLSIFIFVFVYTFLLVWIIRQLFVKA